MTEQDFNDLVDRYERNQVTNAERELLERWLSKRGAQNRFETLSDAEKAQIKASLIYNIESKTKTPTVSLSGVEGKGDQGGFSAELSRSIRIAASIAFILVLGYAGYKYYDHTQEQRFALTEVTAGNDIKKVMLADGSIIWLKPQASIIYPKEFRETGERVISVKGEALFEVAKDKSRQFVVQSRDITTRVYGTSFNIREAVGQTEVFVLTGKVSVTSKASAKVVELLPSEKALYLENNNALSKVEIPTEQIAQRKDYIKGTEYDMSFMDSRVSEFIDRLEDKFDVTISVNNTAINNCLLTADLTDQSLTSSLDKVTKVLNLEYKMDGSKVTLIGSGCP